MGYCTFDSPNLPRQIDISTAAFYVDSGNTNWLGATGSFYSGNAICSFPTKTISTISQGNTIYDTYSVTPYLVYPTTGLFGGASSVQCNALTPSTTSSGTATGAITYDNFQCPDVTLNQMPTGTYKVLFSQDLRSLISSNVFIIKSTTTSTQWIEDQITYTTTLTPMPAATASENATIGTRTSSTTLYPAPAATQTLSPYVASVTSTSVITPPPFSTSTTTVYTDTVTNPLYADPVPSSSTTLTIYDETETVYDSTTITSTYVESDTSYINDCTIPPAPYNSSSSAGAASSSRAADADYDYNAYFCGSVKLKLRCGNHNSLYQSALFGRTQRQFFSGGVKPNHSGCR
ncbi:hypothetical protein FKW77_006051 [Venturia effusa]|uniref:Uncharacterized protein n=1 Tax=Venturia effusa TaxID=50376 RepID=A0A517KZJ3_9PEZI|nr:hypothetical protein FKW77_006051 [Venturia effusa]